MWPPVRMLSWSIYLYRAPALQLVCLYRGTVLFPTHEQENQGFHFLLITMAPPRPLDAPPRKSTRKSDWEKLYLNVVGVWVGVDQPSTKLYCASTCLSALHLACLAQVPSATFSAEQECNRKINPCLMALRLRGSQLHGTRILIYNSSSKALKSLLQIPVAIRGWLHLARAGIKDFFMIIILVRDAFAFSFCAIPSLTRVCVGG